MLRNTWGIILENLPEGGLKKRKTGLGFPLLAWKSTVDATGHTWTWTVPKHSRYREEEPAVWLRFFLPCFTTVLLRVSGWTNNDFGWKLKRQQNPVLRQDSFLQRSTHQYTRNCLFGGISTKFSKTCVYFSLIRCAYLSASKVIFRPWS